MGLSPDGYKMVTVSSKKKQSCLTTSSRMNVIYFWALEEAIGSRKPLDYAAAAAVFFLINMSNMRYAAKGLRSYS